MEISAAAVKALRDKTNAGMMDCKKALVESGGDMEKAIEYLRKMGAVTAEKRMDRTANEGVILTSVEGGEGSIVEVNCETDFVARSTDFLAFARRVLETVKREKPVDLPALMSSMSDGRTLQDHLTELIGKIGEKIAVKRFRVFPKGNVLVDYVHPGSKLGVIVELEAPSAATPILEVGKSLAMQVAAMNPLAVDRESVPTETREKELEIYREQARNERKPENLIERIATGKLNKFFQEFTLLEQSYIRDNTKTVKEYIETASKECGVPIVVKRFARFQVGESE
ncbi:MAG: translation elongation factor Ts [Bacteroidota bacterium]|nr:translation elongation factor Ts [Bacteroidota bacterium]